MNKNIFKRFALLMVLTVTLSGCIATKIVTVPMRIVGAVVSIIPVVGNTLDSTIDTAADVIDKLPI